MVTTNARLYHWRRTFAQWAAENPTLNRGEQGIATATDYVAPKIGTGTAAWNALNWVDGRTGLSWPAAAMDIQSLTLTRQAGLPRVVMPATGTSTAYVGGFGFPIWWFHRGILLGFDWSNDHTATGNVRWQLTLRGFPVGGDIDSPETALNETVTIASPAASGGYTTSIANGGTAFTPTPGGFGSLYVLEISRLGDDGADTLAGSIGLAEVAFIAAT